MPREAPFGGEAALEVGTRPGSAGISGPRPQLQSAVHLPGLLQMWVRGKSKASRARLLLEDQMPV